MLLTGKTWLTMLVGLTIMALARADPMSELGDAAVGVIKAFVLVVVNLIKDLMTSVSDAEKEDMTTTESSILVGEGQADKMDDLEQAVRQLIQAFRAVMVKLLDDLMVSLTGSGQDKDQSSARAGISPEDMADQAYCGCYHDAKEAQLSNDDANDACVHCWDKCFDKCPDSCFNPCIQYSSGDCTNSRTECADQFAQNNPDNVSSTAPSGEPNCD
ncbi:hypothetical protein HDE_01849 [Halotydeus destructor]|nr:hypothetical protein HDE_01849 [Halotydeus destructor]